MPLFDKFSNSNESYVSSAAKLLELTTENFHSGLITKDEYNELTGDILDYQKISTIISDIQRLQDIISAFQEMGSIVGQLSSL